MPSLSDVLGAAAARLREAGLEEPAREARLLCAAALGLDRAALLTQGGRILTEEEQERLAAALARRCRHEPLARITGKREFWGLDFGLNAATLIPRPESETLIEVALALFPDKRAPLRILDLGSGSGCLLLSLLHEFPQASGLGADIAPEAVAQAMRNAAALGLAERARFVAADWNHDGFIGNESGFDLLVSNPPYIATPIIPALQTEVRDYDPIQALDGGADGLAAYRRLTALLSGLLFPMGKAVFEIGHDQGETVPALFHDAGYFAVSLRRDLAGCPRCVIVDILAH